MRTDRDATLVDTTVPPGRPDWLYGTGATATEKALVWVVVGAAVPVVVLAQHRGEVAWSWWQWLVVAALGADVIGGVVANGLGSAKRLYHQPALPGSPLRERVLRNHVVFAVLHVHPFAVAALFPGATWAWAGGWYGAAVVGVSIVSVAPIYLRRPAALGVMALALLVATTAGAPAGLAWLGPMLVLKLVVAHAVPEAPYRPRPGS